MRCIQPAGQPPHHTTTTPTHRAPTPPTHRHQQGAPGWVQGAAGGARPPEIPDPPRAWAPWPPALRWVQLCRCQGCVWEGGCQRVGAVVRMAPPPTHPPTLTHPPTQCSPHLLQPARPARVPHQGGAPLSHSPTHPPSHTHTPNAAHTCFNQLDLLEYPTKEAPPSHTHPPTHPHTPTHPMQPTPASTSSTC